MLLALKRRVPQEGTRICTPVAPPPAATAGVQFSRYPTIQTLPVNPSIVQSQNRVETVRGGRRGMDPASQLDQAPVVNVQDPSIPKFSRYPLPPNFVTRAARQVFSRYTSPAALLPIRDGRLTLGMLVGISAKRPPQLIREQASEAAPPVVLPVGPVTDVAAEDSGSGVESVLVENALVSVSVSDAGSGIEAVDILALVDASDVGIGVETQAILALIPASDSGAGSETTSILALVPTSDSGAGVESAPGILALVPTSDTGSGAESEGILAIVGTSDNGVGLEGFNVTGDLPVGDSGSGAESEGILALVPSSDSGAGVESSTVLAFVSTSDIGACSESAPDILALVGGSDAGVGSESTPEVLTSSSVSDMGAGVEGILDLLAQVPVPDDGSGMESAIFVEDSLTIFEDGVGIELVEVLADASASDMGTGSEEPVVLALVQGGDLGHAVETQSTLVFVGVSDGGSGTEAIAVLRFPVLVPPTAGMGGGGGFAHHEPGMLSGLKRRPVPAHALKTFVEKISADVATLTMEGLKKSTHADPLKVKEIPEEKIREGVIRTLRARITELEAQIRKLKGAHGVALAGALAELEHAQMLAGAVLERALGAEGKLAQLRPIEVHVTLAAPPEETSSWAILLGAVAVWLATETLVPPREKALKEAGRDVAGLLALYGVAKVL